MLKKIKFELEEPITNAEELAVAITKTMTINATLAEIAEYNSMLDKQEPKLGITEGVSGDGLNKCPVCRGLVSINEKYCAYCGQRVEYVPKPEQVEDSDIIPL